MSYQVMQTWRKRTCMLLSERKQSGKAIYCPIPTVWQPEKDKTRETVQESVVTKVWKGEGWRGEHREILGQQISSVWYYNDYMSLKTFPNP